MPGTRAVRGLSIARCLLRHAPGPPLPVPALMGRELAPGLNQGEGRPLFGVSSLPSTTLPSCCPSPTLACCCPSATLPVAAPHPSPLPCKRSAWGEGTARVARRPLTMQEITRERSSPPLWHAPIAPMRSTKRALRGRPRAGAEATTHARDVRRVLRATAVRVRSDTRVESGLL